MVQRMAFSVIWTGTDDVEADARFPTQRDATDEYIRLIGKIGVKSAAVYHRGERLAFFSPDLTGDDAAEGLTTTLSALLR